MNKMQVHNKVTLKEIRKQLRQNMTPSEKILWKKLRDGRLKDLKFKRQHSIGNYIVDFYCAQLRLIVELDGPVHLDKEQKEKDMFRDENLKDMNYTVLRLSNNEIENNLKEVLQKIYSIKAPLLDKERENLT